MQLLRKSLFYLTSILVYASLSFFIGLTPFITNISDRAVVEEWVEESGLYEDLAKTAVEQTAPDTTERGLLDQTAVQNITSSALSADYVEQTTNSVLDAVYVWLNGEEQTLNFSVDLNDRQDVLIEQTVEELSKAAATARTCTIAESRNYDPSKNDCIPEQLRSEQALRAYVQESYEQQDAEGARFDFAEFQANQGISDEDLSAIPTVYGFLKLLPALLAAIIAIGTGLMFYFRRRPQKVLKGFIFRLVPLALFSIIGWVIANRILDAQLRGGEQSASEAIGLRLVKEATQDMAATAYVIAGMYLVLAVVAFIVKRSINSKSDDTDETVATSEVQQRTDKQRATDIQIAEKSGEEAAVKNSETDKSKD